MTTFDKEEVTLSFQFGKGLSELTGSIQKNKPSRSHRWEELETLQNVRISRHPTSAWILEFYAFRIKTLDCKT